jgi:shikimate 5-dehydrogenase
MFSKVRPKIGGKETIILIGSLKPLSLSPSIFESIFLKTRPRIAGKETIILIGSLKPRSLSPAIFESMFSILGMYF